VSFLSTGLTLNSFNLALKVDVEVEEEEDKVPFVIATIRLFRVGGVGDDTPPVEEGRGGFEADF
jgi:hypothetical protein